MQNNKIYDCICLGSFSLGYTESRVPLAAIPSIAMLITINAKWYQREIEKILVRVSSYARLESETINI